MCWIFPAGEKAKETRTGLPSKLEQSSTTPSAGRRDFLQAEGRRHEGFEPWPPIGLQGDAAVDQGRALAGAFEAGVVGIQINQTGEIALAAGVQPVYDNGYLVKSLSMSARVHMVPVNQGLGDSARGIEVAW